MSPLSFHYQRSIQTDLDLNGPQLSFTTQPEDLTKGAAGIATFIGIATATFPNAADNTGSLSYQWYEVGVGSVSNGTNVTGAGTTTLTISDLISPTDNSRQFFLRVDYVPSEDTGNAFNEPHDSNTVTLKVTPSITINTQPAGITTVGTGADATITVDASLSDNSYGELSYQWKLSGTSLTDGANVVGSATSSLTVSLGSTGIRAYTVDISATDADTVTSDSASLDVVTPRNLIKIEAYTLDNNYKTLTVNLDESSYSITNSTFGSDYSVIQYYAVEKDVSLEIGMYGGKGANNGSNTGGQGGLSFINATAEKEVEHTVLGVSNDSAVFLYRGSNLVAVVGEGGDAGTSGNGGDGGGVNISGDSGTGASGNGVGGQTSNLSLTGTYGSLFENSEITLSPGDAIASSPDGGTTISCTKGSYWIDQGISACSDNSTSKIKYVNAEGVTISDSSLIKRGFKPGYTISDTSGLGLSDGGKGGNGATGGSGGTSGAGGGGGSGFGNGTIELVSASQGGSNGPARINLKLSNSNYHIDDEGRILVFSASDNRDPRTLTKTTGKVTPGSNTCLDDARWERFIDLSRSDTGNADGAQNYRLTATTAANPQTKITNATEKNMYRMISSGSVSLVNTRLSGPADNNAGGTWYEISALPWWDRAYTLLCLAWDETTGADVTGDDYSMLAWSTESGREGYGFYGLSQKGRLNNNSGPFFEPTVFGYNGGINFWILPPGVPDF